MREPLPKVRACAGGCGPQARRRSRRHGRSPCVSTQSKRPAARCLPLAGGRVYQTPAPMKMSRTAVGENGAERHGNDGRGVRHLKKGGFF